jgi:hypothetical protein
MVRYLNNKGKILLSPKFLAICSILLALCFILCLMVYPDKANSGPYLDSAHGNTSYGVNRTGLSSFNYSVANCAHCHEQHASIGGAEQAPNTGDDAGPDIYLLFQMLWGTGNPQRYEFCYGCHIGIGSLQSGGLNNYSYSYRAGGDTTTCPSSVSESFLFVTNAGVSQLNCGSNVGTSHMLRNIRNTISGSWNFPSDTNYVDPCSGCHNPHRAKRDPHLTGGSPTRTDGSGNLIVSSVSLPSMHSKDNNLWDLWGDQSGERMRDYSLTNGVPYCAPYRTTGSGTPDTARREPDGCSAVANACQTGPTDCTNGSRLFDTVTFCLDCHKNQLNSQIHGTVQAINWSASGNIHGLATSQNCCNYGDKKTPYPPDSNTDPNPYPNYVLSCLDCHEPHGSPNYYMLRQEVNGTHITNFMDSSYQVWDFCSACHQNIKTNAAIGSHAGVNSTATCQCHRHGFAALPKPADCTGLGCTGANVKVF